MLLPERCAVCSRPAGSPCPACAGDLRRAGDSAPPEGLDLCRSLLVYEGPARRLLTDLKYRNRRAALGWLADGMARLVTPPAGAIVTWPPTSATRRHRRGFDQAELLAGAVARRWGLRRQRTLVRAGATPAQTGSSAAERHRGPPLVATGPVRGPVVLVDDVLTTGATLRAGAQALRLAGATTVVGLTAARTPLRRVLRAPGPLPVRSVPPAPPGVDESLKVGPDLAEDAR